jgi:Holliday junction resolvase RusA-like endonuclease
VQSEIAVSVLTFEIPGRVVSGNAAHRYARGHSYTSKEAAHYKARVASIAKAAALQARWKMPTDCIVEITAYSQRCDLDNLAKITLDALQGIVYKNDRDLYSLRIWREQAREPRLVVRVE